MSRRSLSAVALGVVAGLLSGLFGVGGGIIMVPGLLAALHLDERSAHGTSLAAILPISVAGVAGYAAIDALDVVAGAFLSVGAVGGAVLGSALLHRLPVRALRIAFIVLLVVTAARLALGDPTGDDAVGLTALAIASLVAAGVASGALAGLLGVGGGVIMVPLLIVGFGASALVAKGTSLLVIIPTALAGTYANVRHGNADLRVAAQVGVPGVAGSVAGVAIADRLDARISVVLFAGLLVVVALRSAWREVRRQ